VNPVEAHERDVARRADAAAVRVLYVQYANPAAYPPLEHSAILLADAGCDVRLIGIATLGDEMTFCAHPRIRVALMPTSPRGWRQKLHYLRFVIWTLREALRFRPDCLYASDALAAPAARAIRVLTGARTIYHEHDAPSAEAARHLSIFMRIVLMCRRRLGRVAEICITPNEHRSRQLAAFLNRDDVITIWNMPLKREVRPARAASTVVSMRVLYHGSIVPARVPLTIVEALAQLPETVTLTLVGYDTNGGRHVADLRERARALGVERRLTIAGVLPSRDVVLKMADTCDVGLALLPIETADLNERTMVGASNKPFDYLACGLALLVADRPDWREQYVEAGMAMACRVESAESIAAALRWFHEHPDERLVMGERGRQRILDAWNYEHAFEPIASAILSGVSTREPAPAAAES
jgi:glycosyltransferase involved in cell wall biosynthesis